MAEQPEVVDKEALMRSILFVPCKDKKALHNWIKLFLHLDIPDCIVDPDSNSSPLDMLFEVYSKALRNDDPEFNRVIYWACRDGFKCCAKGTKLISRDRGYINIEDAKLGEVIWSGFSWQPITDWIHDGVKDSVVLETGNGIKLETSPIHRVWAWRPGGEPGWVKVSELTSSDLVCFDTSVDVGQLRSINHEEFQTGYLCGILQGDGCLSLMDKHGIICMSASDDIVLDAFKEACLKYAGRLPKNSPGKRHHDWTICSRPMINSLKALGLTNSYSFEKSIPHVAYTSASAMAGFISGLFDTDGTVTKKKDITFSLTAEKMMRQLQVALAGLGVASRYRANSKLYKGQNHVVHNVVVPQNEIAKLLAAGVLLRAKKANKVVLATSSDAHDAIPKAQLSKFLTECAGDVCPIRKKGHRKPSLRFYETLTRTKALQFIHWAESVGKISSERGVELRGHLKNRWVSVKSVTGGTADFYDLTVENDHSYWSNGLISHNTLGAAILEVLSVVHLRRDVAHMAAIEAQATKAQNYVKGFLQKPYLRDFIIGDNKRETWVVRYQSYETGISITQAEFEALPREEKNLYEEIRQYIIVVICSMAGANGQHVPLFIVDELDVVRDPRAYEESKMIPAPINGNMPITVLVSTRKFSFGLVQKEIDNAEQSGLLLRHWNLIDVTKACPPERHLPDGPRLTMYRSDEELRAVSVEEYESFPDDKQKKYVLDENVMEGCSTCRLFPACKGYLATKQLSKSSLLKPIDHTINQFRTVSVSTARAQLLCQKPSADGLIYPQLDPAVHKITAAQMAEKITGDRYPEDLSKDDLIRLMKTVGLKFHAGMDFGYSHNFAVAAGATDGYRAFLIGGISMPELDPVQQVEICKRKIKHLNPIIFADPENPQMAKFLKKAGFKIREWKKGAGSVMGGIDIVRSMLRPAIGEPRLFFLKGDPDCELIFKRMSQYHWKLDPDGTIGKTPDDDQDDECFTGETEVLTKNHGWMRLDELKRCTTIMAVTDDGQRKWEPARYLLKKEYEGKLYTVDHPRIKFSVTRKHQHAVCLVSDYKAGNIRTQRMTTSELLESGADWAFLTPQGSLMQVTPVKKVQFQESEYDGTVYCITTSTGMFLARNGGRQFVAGNCDAARYWLMNVFATKGGAKVDSGQTTTEQVSPLEVAGHKLIREILHEQGVTDGVEEAFGKGISGNLKWNI